MDLTLVDISTSVVGAPRHHSCLQVRLDTKTMRLLIERGAITNDSKVAGLFAAEAILAVWRSYDLMTVS